MPPPAVLFRSVVSMVDQFPVLTGVDLAVRRGESVLLTGPNGAGKTSLLRAIAGLLPVTSGEAFVLGHDLAVDRRSVRRRVGMFGHRSFLYDDLTVAENVRFATRAAGGDGAGADQALSRLGLSGRVAKVTVGHLSAGQRRKAALAILVARDPEMWLLDEPHAGLDTEGRDVLDDIVAGAVARGRTLLLTSHEIDRAGRLAGRRIDMVGGTAVAGVDAESEPRVPTDVA